MKYIRVDEAPEKLKDNEMDLIKPDFLEEVSSISQKRGSKGVATIRSIRDAFMVITGKYDESINPYRLVFNNYDNMVYDGNEGFAKLIQKIVKDLNLPLLDRAVETKLLARHPKIDTVYYVSDDLEGSGAFIKLGFHMGEVLKSQKKIVKTEDVV
jgi:hypothetical protein